jgi:hypothetical protein
LKKVAEVERMILLFLVLSLKKDRLTFWVEREGNFGGCEKREKGEKGEKQYKY